MIDIETEHFNINRLLLRTIGLWPYQKSVFNRLHLMLFYSVLITFIIFQFVILATSDCTTNLLVKSLSTAFVFISFTIKYNSFYINNQTIKVLLEELQRTYNELKDTNEIAIIEKYGNSGKRYTERLTILFICGALIFVSSFIWRSMLDDEPSLNKYQHITVQTMSDYFNSEEKYFYLIVLYADVALGMGVLTLLATGAILQSCARHACGMFRIASYRIKHNLRMEILQNINVKKEYLIFKGIIHAVEIHRKAMKYFELLISSFNTSYLFFTMVTVISMSLNLFRVFQAYSKNIFKDLVIPFIYLIIQYMYIFLANYTAQDVTDHNNHISITAYNVQWYIAPLHIQRIILFIIQRSAKPFHLNIGGLFTASLENFASVMSTTISYFTVMYSTTS